MKRQRGFILAFVITALALVGVVMFVLAGGSNVILFHADSAYLRAVERNLNASGLAWARQRLSEDHDLVVGHVFELDTGQFSSPAARLTVRILAVQEGRVSVRVETSCRKGKRTFHASRDYAVGREESRPQDPRS